MMIKFNLEPREFKVCPEGERELEIIDAVCTPSGKPTSLKIKLKDVETGAIIQNKYTFDNSKSLFAMAMLCKVALKKGDAEEFDTNRDTKSLIGKNLLCEVYHSEGTSVREDGTYPTFANIRKVISLVNDDDDISPRNSIADNPVEESAGYDL